MHRKKRFIASMVLSAAFLLPFGAFAMPAPQDEHEKHEQEMRERRVYDSVHKQYRNWDSHEDDAYRRWFKERHETYVGFEKLDRKRQEEYWKWRHDHEDHR